MDIQVEKVMGIYQKTILFPIWKESIPLLDERRINWSYEGNVYGKAQLWLLKNKETSEYFGCSALLPRCLFINGKKRLCAIIADTAVKKRYRTLIPALKLHKEIMKNSQEFELILAFPNEIAEAVLKMAGFKQFVNLVNNIKILRSRIVIERKIKSRLVAKLLLPFAMIFDFGSKLFNSRIRLPKKYECAHVDTFDERFDQIMEEAKKKFHPITDRNFTYLNWRYRGSPYKDYKIFVVNQSNLRNLVGYIVYHVNDGCVFVDDFLWLEDSLKLEDLLYIFVEDMRKKEIEVIYFTLNENSIVQKAFKKGGFFIRENVQTIFYFSSNVFINEIIPDLRQKAFITYGDQDI